jgi:hypothetical protein
MALAGRQCNMKKAIVRKQWLFNEWWRFTDSNRGPVDYDEKVY